MKTKIVILSLSLMFGLSTLTKAQCSANAGIDDTACEKNVLLQGSYSHNVGSSILWSCTDPNVIFINPTAEITTAIIPDYTGSSDTMQFTLTETISSPSCISSDEVEIIFFKTPNVEAGPIQNVCGLTANLNALEPDFPSYIGTWSYFAGPVGGPVFFDDSHLYNTTVTVPSPGTYTFQWLLENGTCDSSDFVTISFLPFPHSEAGPTQSVCGYIAQLEADTLGTGIQLGSWTSSVPGIIITPAVVGNVESTVTIDATPVATQFQNSMLGVWFYWTGTNSLGCSATDSVQVNFYEVPYAFAGADDSICGNQIQLISTQSVSGSLGMWSVVPPMSATFSPNNSSDTVDVTATSGFGIYYIVWRESNALNTLCFDRDTIEIKFMEVPHPDAGLDFSVCGKYAELNATPTTGNGYWIFPTGSWYSATAWHVGDTTFCASCYTNQNVVFYYPSENDTVTMYWYDYVNEGCYGYDSVNVYFGSIEAAVTLVDPADTVVCGLIFTGLNAQMPAYGAGYWYDVVANTIFYPYPTQTNPDSLMINSSAYGLHNFYWVTVNGDCRDTSAAVPVWFNRNGGISGNISGLGGSTDYTAGLFVEGSPIVRTSANPDALGSYFMQANAGDYYLKIDNDNPTIATGIATTYYGDAWQWSDATVLTVAACDTITADINMYTFSQAAGGVGNISGLVTFDGGEPVENVNVYLQTEPIDEIASLQQTSINGDYSFVNIPNGDYKIHVDIPGLPQVTTYIISITPTDSVFPNINFIVDTTIFKDYGYGIYADSNYVNSIVNPQSQNSVMRLYPVPFHQDLNLVISRDAHFNIEWFDVTGRMCFSDEMDLTTGTNKMDVPVDLPKGVCYVKITEGNTVYVKKLMRE